MPNCRHVERAASAANTLLQLGTAEPAGEILGLQGPGTSPFWLDVIILGAQPNSSTQAFVCTTLLVQQFH